MVVDLCSSHFHTIASCNKLCADGYDVTNLVSPDPSLRRRGFKLEYFVRPPLQVILEFAFQVELSRVDVELWPWGMDLGQAGKKVEISTSSHLQRSKNHNEAEQKECGTAKSEDPKESNHPISGRKSGHSNGHGWSLQAKQWDVQAPDVSQPRGVVSNSQSNSDSRYPDAHFKLIARCELKDETRASFYHSNFRPRAPFLSAPPQLPANCQKVELWSRGFDSLCAVTRLRVTIPFGGGGSSLGLKALAVWGQPSSCCPAEEVERVQRIHESTERRRFHSAPVTVSARKPTIPLQISPSVSIPEEFLDPITQEVMTLPMLLPSGVSVDSATVDEHQKREAAWGRPPSDPFTGVPFSATSKPLPNPQLKSRIDRFLLQKGMDKKEGVLGREDQQKHPHASRLVTSNQCGRTPSSPRSHKSTYQPHPDHITTENTCRETSSAKTPSASQQTKNIQSLCTDGKAKSKRQHQKQVSEELPPARKEPPQAKRPRNDLVSVHDSSSHEQRLAASLDEALLSALKGRPSFTANLSRKDEREQTTCLPSTSAGAEVCSACSRSVSVYSTSASSIYRLTCSHLLCMSCLKQEPKQASSRSGHVPCPTCGLSSPRSDIVRVHH